MGHLIEKPSHYQEKIFDFVENGEGNARVKAVAGGGKTSTLLHAATLLDNQGTTYSFTATSSSVSRGSIFLAFNKSIQQELERKLDDTAVEARTIHSIGLQALRNEFGNLQVEGRKYRYLVRDYLKKFAEYQAWKDRKDLENDFTTLIDLVRLKGIPPSNTEALQELCEHHNLTEILDAHQKDAFFAQTKRFLKEGMNLLVDKGQIDFTDMLYLPLLTKAEFSEYDWVLVDEAQDLSKAQLEVALRCLADGGRALSVGDSNQAIYGFAGADAESFRKVKERTSAIDLPLSICYRCPRSHIELAQDLVPEIEPAPWATEGVVEYIYTDELVRYIREGDMVIGRRTKPLVQMCMRLIKEGMHARVKGRSIGRNLIKLLDKVADMEGFTYHQIDDYLKAYWRNERQRLLDSGVSKQYLEYVRDQVEILRIFAGNFEEARSIRDLTKAIEMVFSDEEAAIWFSTVHRAKGLENERIFILLPEELPYIWPNQKEWQYEQELNLRYVALTRAKEELFFVEERPMME